MLWLLGLLGAPRDPDENERWQCRHPARVSFACAACVAGFFGVVLVVTTRKIQLGVGWFVASFAFLWVVYYVGARVRIRRGKPVTRRND